MPVHDKMECVLHQVRMTPLPLERNSAVYHTVSCRSECHCTSCVHQAPSAKTRHTSRQEAGLHHPKVCLGRDDAHILLPQRRFC